MTTAWAHLPNARHIDLVLKSFKEHPRVWCNTLMMTWNEAHTVAWNTVQNKALDNIWYNTILEWQNELSYVVWDGIWYSAWIRLCGATMALIAYDDCAHLLSSNPEEVKLLAKLGSIPAILLLPACIVFNKTKELV